MGVHAFEGVLLRPPDGKKGEQRKEGKAKFDPGHDRHVVVRSGFAIKGENEWQHKRRKRSWQRRTVGKKVSYFP